MKRCLTLKTAAIVAAALFLVGVGAAGALALSGGGGSSSAPPSQAQADAASPDFDSAFGGDAAPPAGEAGARGALNRDVLETATAKLLGITAKDVRAGLQQGKSLAQLAAEHNVTRDALESAIKTAEKTYLDKNVKDALVTQQYADQTLQQVSARIDAIVDQTARARTPAP
jgi:hypothetical protein